MNKTRIVDEIINAAKSKKHLKAKSDNNIIVAVFFDHKQQSKKKSTAARIVQLFDEYNGKGKLDTLTRSVIEIVGYIGGSPSTTSTIYESFLKDLAKIVPVKTYDVYTI